MFSLLGYEIIEKISIAERIAVYRAKRLSDQKWVTLKTLNSEYPTLYDIAQLRQEYEILKSLDIPGVIKAYDFIKQDNTHTIVLENFTDSQNLKEFIKGEKLSIAQSLEIAIQLASILEDLHKENVIHKDINPQNILIANSIIKIIDFSLATKLSLEEEKIYIDVAKGTLPYISPEQTGRMNRTIDYRTDFYSLGVTLYEMLTGTLPFQAKDSLSWVHAHIARKPLPLDIIEPNIPAALSNIVLKLLSKAQENRYQTAHALKEDLEHCLKEWREHRTIQNFPLAQHDKTEVLHFPQKLYGRENEIKLLLEIISKITQGEQAMLLISGYSGIGKTSLIKELQKILVEQQVFFTTGKFEQFKHDIPYSSQALHPLVSQILSKPKAEVALWKKKILDALSINAQIIIDVIPELELIIGKQPSVPELPQREAQARFEMIFKDFIKIFTKPEHPLVVCMEDLQWADLASLDMLQNILSKKMLSHFLLIGTYRENEVKPGHVLLDTLSALERSRVSVYHLSLHPLNLEDINQFIKDILQCKVNTLELAQLTLEKTGGNPFFIHTLLTHLFKVKALSYNVKQHEWVWDMENIKKISMTENVIDLLIKKIDNLPIKSKMYLQIAACIGTKFDLQLLAHINDETPIATANHLWPALQENMLIPIGENYKLAMVDKDFAASEPIFYQFAHDRIQQAAYSQLTEIEKQNLSLQIGRLKLPKLLSNLNEDELFTIVSYFSASLNLLTDDEEKNQVAKLMLRAAYKAKQAIAYNIAEKYFRQVINLLGENAWKKQYQLIFEAHKGMIECLYLLDKHQEMLIESASVKSKIKKKLDLAKILFLETILFSARGQFHKVIDVGLQGLNLLGMKITKNPSKLKTMWLVFRVCWLLRGKRIFNILELPPVRSPEKKLLMDFVVPVFTAMYTTAPTLLFFLSFRSLLYSIKHGCAPGTAASLIVYNVFHLAAFGNYTRNYEIGSITLRLVDKYYDPQVKVIVYTILGSLIFFNKMPYNESIKYLTQAYRIGQESGERVMSFYTIGVILFFEIYQCVPLEELAKKINNSYAALPKIGSKKGTGVYNDVHAWIEISEVFVNTLRSGPDNSKFKEYIARFLDKKIPVSDQNILRAGVPLHVCTAYIMEDWDTANILITNLRPDSLIGQITTAPNIREYFFFSGLVLLATHSSQSRWKKLINHFWINVYIKIMKKHAINCAANYEAKYLLLLTAKHLVHGNTSQAINYYEQTINSARKYELTSIEAITHEFIGRWFIQQRQLISAEGYLKKALYAYQQWGASAKVNALLAKYPALLTRQTLDSDKTLNSEGASLFSKSHSSDSFKLLDLVAIMKSTQAISGNVDLKSLLNDLVKTMIEISGAERCILMLVRNGKLFIEASTYANDNTPTILPHQNIDDCVDICRPIINYVEHTKQTMVLDNAFEQSAYKDDPYIKKQKILSLLCLPVMHQQNLIGILYFENNLASGAFTQRHIQISQLLASQAAISLEISQLYAAYNQFVPHQFLDLLGKRSIVEVSLGDHIQKNMTILFSDIRGFTGLSEQYTPAEVFQFMNEYLSWMEPIIIKHGGLIDKYIGDSIMALFPKQIDTAVHAAIAMQKKLTQMNIKHAKQNKSIIRMGIGINYGTLILGTLGGKHRIETSVLGDAVNLASRLEDLTKEYNSTLLISDMVYRHLSDPDLFNCRFAGWIKLAGKEQETGVWEIYDGDPEELYFAKKAVAKWYNEAIDMFNKKDYELALTLFQRCSLTLPNDKLIKKYILDCQSHLLSRV